MASFTSQTVRTTLFEGQKPGTSGLRKPVKVFQQENYTENFIQASLIAGLGDKIKGAVLAVGGDGRFFCVDAAEKIARVAAANGVCLIYAVLFGQ